MSTYDHPPSPRWGVTIKIVVGLSIAIGIGAMFVAFRSIIGPLLLAIMLAYFINPIIVWINQSTRLNWRLSASLVFLILLILVVGVFTAIGVVLVGQIESLFNLIVNFVNNQLPILLQNLSEFSFTIGPLQLDLSQLNLTNLADQFLNNLQSLIGQAGGLVGAVASGAVGIVGWTAFVLIIAYFLVAETGRVSGNIQFLSIPGYDYDIRRMSRELGRIWNAYLRGQFVVILLVIIVASIIMSGLGVRFALAIALFTGIARLVPYVGPFSVSMITFLVAAFQSSNYFNLQQIYFALIVVIIMIVVDQIFDNIIAPRLLGQSLGVHPAGILIAALILAQLIGFVGLVLAAPVLASIRLILQYVIRKLFDQDPWPDPEIETIPVQILWSRLYNNLRAYAQMIVTKFRRKDLPTSKPDSQESEQGSSDI